MEYLRLREQGVAEGLRRLEHAGSLDAEIKRLAGSRIRMLKDTTRLILNEFNKPDGRSMRMSEDLTAEFKAIGLEIRRRLESLGLPADYLEPFYYCPVCKDTGKVGFPDEKLCECAGRRMAEMMIRDGGVGIDPAETFARYDAAVFSDEPMQEMPEMSQREYMRRARKVCEEFADSFPNSGKLGMFFYGNSGLGKTFLLNCIGNRLLERAILSMRVTSYDLMETLRDKHMGRGDNGADSRMEVMRNIPLLMLDDLGSEAIYENISITGLFHLVNERVSNGRHLIISTNLSPNKFSARYTERISSRVLDRERFAVLKFMGADARLRAR